VRGGEVVLCIVLLVTFVLQMYPVFRFLEGAVACASASPGEQNPGRWMPCQGAAQLALRWGVVLLTSLAAVAIPGVNTILAYVGGFCLSSIGPMVVEHGMERPVADQGALLRRRLDALERLVAEQAARVEEVAARHGALQEEHEALCGCICAAGLLAPAVLQARGAQRNAIGSTPAGQLLSRKPWPA